MFGNLIFFILALLIIAFGLGTPLAPHGFAFGMAAYLATLAIIVVQNKLIQGKKILAELELLVFLFVYHFVFGADEALPDSNFLRALFSFCLYLAGLGIAYEKVSHIRVLFPLAIPFLAILGLFDLVAPTDSLALTLLGTMLFTFIILAFLPLILRKIWKIKPLEDKELEAGLEAVCQKLRFVHGGIGTWTVMNHMLTAAIIGIIPKFRYVMFSQKLIDSLSTEQLEAILTHEIAHSKYKHLWIYPFLIFAMIIIIVSIPLENFSNMTMLIFYAIIMATYVRIVMGYFSRIFERQADLYVIKTGMDPDHMIGALDKIGILTGNSHKTPNWHHYSIHQRIEALERAKKDPDSIRRHSKKVWASVAIFFSIILLVGALL